MAESKREGWIMLSRGEAQLWEKELPGELFAGVYCWADGDVTYVVKDGQDRTITGGKIASLEAGMDACEQMTGITMLQ